MSVGRWGASKVGTSKRTLECLVITLENGSCLKRPWNCKSGMSAGAMWTDELWADPPIHERPRQPLFSCINAWKSDSVNVTGVENYSSAPESFADNYVSVSGFMLGDLAHGRGEDEKTPILSPAWIMVLRPSSSEISLFLYESRNWTSRELVGPWKILPPVKRWTPEMGPLCCTYKCDND